MACLQIPVIVASGPYTCSEVLSKISAAVMRMGMAKQFLFNYNKSTANRLPDQVWNGRYEFGVREAEVIHFSIKIWTVRPFSPKRAYKIIPQLEDQALILEHAFWRVQFGSLDHLSEHKCSPLQPLIWIPGTRFGSKVIRWVRVSM